MSDLRNSQQSQYHLETKTDCASDGGLSNSAAVTALSDHDSNQALPKRSRDFTYDWIKAISILGVIYIHSSVVVVNFLPTTTDIFGWFIITYMNVAVRWCVPAFVMTSGALLLAREHHNSRLFFRRRFWRIGIPLIAWTLLYEIARALMVPSESFNFLTIGEKLLFQQPYQHLYFLIILLGLMLITPWLSRVVHVLSKHDVALLTILFLCIGMAFFPYTGFAPVLFIPYIGYYLYGNLVRGVHVPRKTMFWFSVVICGIAVVLTVVRYMLDGSGVLSLTELYRRYSTDFSYLSPGVVMMSLLAYPMLIQPGVTRRISTRPWLTTIVQRIGRQSLGLYVIHPIILLFLYWVFAALHDLQQAFPIPLTILVFFITVFFSWVLTEIIGRIPVIRRIV